MSTTRRDIQLALIQARQVLKNTQEQIAAMEDQLAAEDAAAPLELSSTANFTPPQHVSELNHAVASLPQSQASLHQNEHRYQQVVDDQTEMICRYDADFRLTFVNRAYCEFCGKSAQELLGTNLLSYIPLEQRDAARANVLMLSASSPVLTNEHQSIAADQTQRWFQWTDRALLDDTGNIIEYQGVGRDITDRVRLLEAQQQHTQTVDAMRLFLQSTLDAFPANAAVLASDGTILNVNTPWKRFADENDARSVTHTVGENYLEVCNRSIGSDTTEGYTPAEGIRAVIEGRLATFYHEYPYHSPTEQRWFQLSVTPFDEAPPCRVVVAHIDITARKRAELVLQDVHTMLERRVIERTSELQVEKDRVEAILDNSFDSILLVQDMLIQHTNLAFDKLFTYAGEVDAHRSLLDLIVPDDQERVKALIATVAMSEANTQIEACACRYDGSTFEAEISVGHINADGFVCTIRDVTERKRAQRAVDEERNLLRTLIDTALDYIYVKDIHHRFLLGNKAHIKARGLANPEEIVGKTDFDFFPAEVAAQFHADEDKIIATGIPLIDNELSVKGYSGGFVWASSTKVPLRNLKGEIIGIVGITRDMTQRKAQEQQLRYHASLQESVSDAVITTDMEYHIQTWNQAATRIYGWQAEEVIGKLATVVLRTQYPTEDRQQLTQRFLEQGFWSSEFIQYRKDGGQLHVWCAITMLKDDQGVPIGIVGVNHDITERKLQERQLRYYANLLENVTDAVISTDMDFNILSWNHGAEVIYGWRAEEVIGKNALAVLQPQTEHHQGQDEILNFLHVQDHWQGELIHHRKNGEQVPLLMSASLLKDEHDTPIGTVEVSVDITERKKAEHTLQAKMEEEREFQTYLKSLHEITIELTQINQIDAFYKRAVELGRERLGFERLSLFLYEGSQQTAIGTYGTDVDGTLTDEHELRFTPDLNSIEMRAMQRTERFAVDYDSPLYTIPAVQVGVGWNAAAVLWNGTEGLGWLIADNAISHVPATKARLDILALYAMAVGAILAQKKVESTLRESELRYRLLAENATDVVTRATMNADYIYMSPSSEAVLGYQPEELQGKNAGAYAHPDDIPIIERSLQAAVDPSATIRLETRFKHKQGHWIWLETLIRPIHSAITDELEEFIASSRDITERKQAEFALRDSEEKFRMLVEAAPVAIVIADHLGKMTLINQRAEEMFGYRQAELVGQAIEMLIPENIREQYTEQLDNDIAAPSMRRIGPDSDLHAKHKDGIEFPVEIYLSFIKTNDIFMLMSFIVDISERKQITAELERQRAFLQQVIDVSPSMIFVKDYNSHFILANPTVAKIYNTTVAELLGKGDADFNPSSREVSDFLAGDRRVIDLGETLHVEEPVTDPTGVTRWLQTTKVPIIGADGKSKYVLGISTDITERRDVEETLRQAVQKEKELGDLKTRFVSMASHEFRTPLATILALTETVITYRRRLADDQIDQRLTKIQNQVWHLRDIIEDVLQLARIQARRIEFNPVMLNLDSLCRSVVDEFESRPNFAHHIRYHCDDMLYEVKLDRRLMRQVISNLVSNAIKYSSLEKTITIDLGMKDDMVTLTVADEGIGIPETDLKYLFEPFHRAANVGTIPGTGLGLVITKESIELHGGTINVQSKLDEGTTFIVNIPIT